MIKRILHSEILKGSLILLIMFNLFNLMNFVFHFVMARMLGPVDYGTLAVLMSIIYIYGVPTEAIQTIISRYSSRFNLSGNKGNLKNLMKRSLSRGSVVGIQLFLVALIFSILLSDFLGVNFWLLFFTNFFIFLNIFSPVVRGTLQGRKKFYSLGISMNAESILKILFSILFVYFGFRVFGAIGGVLIGSFVGFALAIYFNKDIFNSKEERVDFDGIYQKSVPYFISMFVIFIVLSMDIILAKRFFSDEIAGQYSVLSMIGKMIFFGTMAVSKAMFPLTSERYDSKSDSSSIFKRALSIVVLLCLGGIAVYWIFPEIFVYVLYGEQYVAIAPYLVYSGIALSFLSLTNLFLIYGLSTSKLRYSWVLIFFIFLQIGMFYTFNNSILEYILAFMFSNIVMFIGTLFLIKT